MAEEIRKILIIFISLFKNKYTDLHLMTTHYLAKETREFRIKDVLPAGQSICLRPKILEINVLR